MSEDPPFLIEYFSGMEKGDFYEESVEGGNIRIGCGKLSFLSNLPFSLYLEVLNVK